MRLLFLCQFRLVGPDAAAYVLSSMTFPQPERTDRQPIFNIPRILVVLIALMAGIHLVRETLLSDDQALWLVFNFAFFPARPETWFSVQAVPGAEIWSYLTYSLLHADWVHLGLNALWMVAFGSPLAWRFGAARFLAFSAIAVIAGALLHLLANGGDQIPMIGASAAVSAHMAGAARFLFIAQPGIVRSYWSPAASLAAVFSDARTLMFIGAWFAINLAVGLIGWASPQAGEIAWEAHVGGFIAGLVLFPLFDPVRRFAGDDEPPRAA